MDFGFLKEVMVEYIHDPCDHGMILYKEDPMLFADAHMGLLKEDNSWVKLVLLDVVPTAENLAKYWYEEMYKEVDIASGGHATLIRVRVQETPNSVAYYPFPIPMGPDEVELYLQMRERGSIMK